MIRSDISKLTTGLWLAIAACSPSLPAQEPGPTPLELPSLTEELSESGLAPSFSLEAVESASEPVAATGGEQVRASRWKVSPHLHLEATYDDNIFIRATGKVADFVFTAAPGLAIGYWDYEEEMEGYLERDRSAALLDKGEGSFFVLDYTAILLDFARTQSQDAFNQDARFDIRWRAEKLAVRASSHFESKSETDINIGGRLRRTAVATEVSADYQFSPKTSLSVGFENVIEDRDNFVRTSEWRNETYLDYKVTPLTRVGVGGALGRLEVEGQPDRVFERMLARLDYESTAKLGLAARGGLEFRQTDSAFGDSVTPVFDIKLRYAPAEGTLITLDGYRRKKPSIAQPDEDYTATGVGLHCERSVRTGLRLSIDGGYEHTAYDTPAGRAPRDDDFFYARAGLLYNFAHWGNIGISYEYRQKDSTEPSASFENNRITFQVGLIY